VVRTTSHKNADLKTKRVGTAKEKCTSSEHAVDTPSGHTHGSRSEQDRKKQSVRFMEGDDRSNDSDDEFRLFQISHGKAKPFTIIPVKVNGEDCPMELDTGASVSIMSEEAWKKRFA